MEGRHHMNNDFEQDNYEKALYYDSNDEMYFENEISDSDITKNPKKYIKVKLRQSE